MRHFRDDWYTQVWLLPMRVILIWMYPLMLSVARKYENLRSKHEDALDLETLLLSIFVRGKVLDMKDLCIEPRKHAFRLCVGVSILNHDGNLPDSCIIAVMMALVD